MKIVILSLYHWNKQLHLPGFCMVRQPCLTPVFGGAEFVALLSLSKPPRIVATNILIIFGHRVSYFPAPLFFKDSLRLMCNAKAHTHCFYIDGSSFEFLAQNLPQQ
jgi:hypothetical protein